MSRAERHDAARRLRDARCTHKKESPVSCPIDAGIVPSRLLLSKVIFVMWPPEQSTVPHEQGSSWYCAPPQTIFHPEAPVALRRSCHALHSVTGRPDDWPVHTPYALAAAAVRALAPTAAVVKKAAAAVNAGSSRNAATIIRCIAKRVGQEQSPTALLSRALIAKPLFKMSCERLGLRAGDAKTGIGYGVVGGSQFV